MLIQFLIQFLVRFLPRIKLKGYFCSPDTLYANHTNTNQNAKSKNLALFFFHL